MIDPAARTDSPGRAVILLMGPTAAGKTDAALSVADRVDVDLVSVDSAMVYRRMDIGTAKPEPEVLSRYPHALVDILDPDEAYSAARFVADADEHVRLALDRGRTPVLVGGTMLYFRAFKFGLNELPEADTALRARIAARGDELGWPALHRELAKRDPVAAARIDPNNGPRIQRALEVLELTGRPLGSWWDEPSASASERLGVSLVEVAIMPPERSELHARIDRRLSGMLERGLVDEVRALRADRALSVELPSMRSVGYRQVWRHLDGEYGVAEMRQRLAAATRGLARRQLTWLRAWQGLHAQVADADEAAGFLRAKVAKSGP